MNIHKMSLRMCLTNDSIPTTVGVNTVKPIVLLTLTTNCDGAVLVTTQRTHSYLIAGSPIEGDKIRTGYITPAFLGQIVWQRGGGGTGTGGEWSKKDAWRANTPPICLSLSMALSLSTSMSPSLSCYGVRPSCQIANSGCDVLLHLHCITIPSQDHSWSGEEYHGGSENLLYTQTVKPQVLPPVVAY